MNCSDFGDKGIFIFYTKAQENEIMVWGRLEGEDVEGRAFPLDTISAVLQALPDSFHI